MSASSPRDRPVPSSVNAVIHDEKRLTALRRYDILDTDPDPAFDRIAHLAAHLFDAPIALVNFVDADRQWFKSSVGLDDDQTGLDVSFCVYTVEQGDVLVVEDLSTDDRFADNPYVTDHGVRFYAGAPLVAPGGQRLGTVCVLDTEPRSPDADTLACLSDLAAMVVDELELRRERIEHRQSEERWRRLVDNHPGPIHVSVDGQLAYANREMARLFGVDVVDDLIGRHLSDFVPTEEQARIRDRAQTVYEEREAADLIESRIERPDGTERIVVVRSVPIRYRGRAAAQTMIWDVTERKAQERELQESHKRLRLALEAADAGTFDHDLSSGRIRWDARSLELYGLDPGSPERDVALLEEIILEEDFEQLTAALDRTLERDDPRVDVSFRIRRVDDGTVRHIRSHGLVLRRSDGTADRVIGVNQDVTERVQQREELRTAKEAAEEAARLKSALLSNINHELRTPLTSIISFSKLLTREPELADAFADRILGGGKRLLHTLNTVMDFAELETDSVSPTPTLVNVGDVARATVNTFAHLIERKDLSVRIREPDGGLTVSLDERILEQILTQIVHNAVKFTDEGTVTISVRRADDDVNVSVSDSGVGIDPAFLPHVFDEFAQASSGDDRMHEGNGIGLTIVNRLVDELDGEITVDSPPENGTTVTVRLPILAEPAPPLR